MHNLTIERCWADPVIDLYELCITCSNDQITACAMECWGSDEILDDFANKIEKKRKEHEELLAKNSTENTCRVSSGIHIV